MMIELKQLQFFTACVEEGSFSRAAEVLYTSQPNVSKVINELEKEIGIKLFERGGRGVEPTEDGRNIYQYAYEMIKKERSISNLIKSKNKDMLRVCFNHSRSLAQVLADYYDYKCSNVYITMREGDTDFVMDDVQHFKSDIGMTFIIEKQLPAFQYALSRSGLEMEIIREDPAQISIGEKNHLSRIRSIRLDKLIDESFVRHSDDYFSLENGICMLEPRLKPAIDNAIVSNSVQFVINMLTDAGKCNISVPTFYKTRLASGVSQVMIDPPIKVFLVCIYRYKPAGFALDFLNFIKSQNQAPTYMNPGADI
ncbi:MAG: LysR family transcriptional regulator [Lachnospiraceae bacterium]|nr:LysR family transcriptional regulator [Lachnospiraceae bacterium]